MVFPVHGKFSANYEDCILSIKAIGPVNAEFFSRYEDIVAPLRKEIIAPRWGSFVEITGQAILPFNSNERAKLSIENAMKDALIATCLCLVNSESPNVSKAFWEKLYNEVGIPFQFFDNEQDAVNWLKVMIKDDSSAL